MNEYRFFYNMKDMHERILSILSGSTIGFSVGVTTGKILETLLLSLLGGLAGAAGGKLWKVIAKRYTNSKKKDENGN